MSNITLFTSGALAVPAYLRAGADDLTKALAGGSGGKSISIKGGVWRMIVDGQEVAKNEDRAMNLIVLAAAPKPGRTFYMGKYEEGKDTPPSCWSADGVAPNEEVPAATRQNATCNGCPQNIEGSGEGKSRACRFMQRLAVAVENDSEDNVYRLQLPAKSIFGRPEGGKMPLQAYAKFLAGHGVPITGVVTEARFNTAEAVPVLTFAAVRPLSEAEYNRARAMAETEDAKRAIEYKIAVKEQNSLFESVEYKEAPVAKKASPFTAAPAPVAAPAEDDAEEEAPAAQAAPEPVKRASKKPAVVEAPAAKQTAHDILSAWGDDDDE